MSLKASCCLLHRDATATLCTKLQNVLSYSKHTLAKQSCLIGCTASNLCNTVLVAAAVPRSS